MTPEIYIMAAISAAMALALICVMWNAPMGYEDHEGFHLGREPGE